MLPAIIGGIAGLATLGYNIYSDSRNRYDEQRQQRIANQFSREQLDMQQNALYHGAQIRANDLRAAGLHPTLAAGNAAGTGTAHPPPHTSGKMRGVLEAGAILDNILKAAQIKGVNAAAQQAYTQAARTGNQINIDNEMLELKKREVTAHENDVKARESAEWRALELHDYKAAVDYYATHSAYHNMTTAEKVAVQKSLEAAYMEKEGGHMPTRDSMISDFERALETYNMDHSETGKLLKFGVYIINAIFGKR